MLKSPKQFARWKNLVVNRVNNQELSCGSNYNEIFGEIMGDIVEKNCENVTPKD